mgnify:CR=1 FL=1
MPIFEKPPKDALTTARDRWTPLYLEHGRLEVDDSSVKWIGADRTLLRIPIATVSALMLGPGTTVTPMPRSRPAATAIPPSVG